MEETKEIRSRNKIFIFIGAVCLCALPNFGAGCLRTAELTQEQEFFNSPPVNDALDADLQFIPDSGVRIEDASNPGVHLNADGSIALLFEDRSGQSHDQRIATSEDGLIFLREQSIRDDGTFRAHKLPDGTYRVYTWDEQQESLMSMSSTNGVDFTSDAGARYTLQSFDNHRMGIYDIYNDANGNVVLLYIGDMMGLNSVRRAFSTDNGMTFQFDRGNIFGDETFGGGGQSYVDQKSIVLPDGRVRALVMRQGVIYSFMSDKDQQFIQEPGVRLQAEDFTDISAISLHDPQPIRLLDGRYRIYVTAIIGEGEIGAPHPNDRQVIVSATTH
ncbi:MAG TPA: hypothetical protein VJB65_04690 [Patescibacteria group bacterium]|nr:hypothetical protein [Patescibacteria group bacterium]